MTAHDVEDSPSWVVIDRPYSEGSNSFTSTTTATVDNSGTGDFLERLDTLFDGKVY
jgi:hypothetical protein